MRWKKEVIVVTCAHLLLFTTVSQPATSLFVGIHNVNMHGKNFVYETEILGVDGLADVAILRIVPTGHQPRVNPDKHPTIKFSCKKPKVGQTVFNISNPLNKDLGSFVSGTIRDPEWFDNSGTQLAANIVTNLLVYPASSGSPVLDEHGKCLGLVAFGFANADLDVQEVGFGGGCDAPTLKRIICNIMTHHSVNPVPGQNYVTNLKGYLGDTQILGINTYTIQSLFPSNFNRLQIRGFVLTTVDVNSPLANLIDAPPLQPGDIVVWGQKRHGKRIVFGASLNQRPIGDLLWFVNPKGDNLVTFGVIRDPMHNTEISKVRTHLNLIPDPNIEAPPQNGLGSSVATDCSAQAGPNELQLCGTRFVLRGFEQVRQGFGSDDIMFVPTTCVTLPCGPNGYQYLLHYNNAFWAARLTSCGQLFYRTDFNYGPSGPAKLVTFDNALQTFNISDIQGTDGSFTAFRPPSESIPAKNLTLRC
jgi:hypothetical protein